MATMLTLSLVKALKLPMTSVHIALLRMAKASRAMLNPNSALLTLTYLGAERAIPNYNVMGLAKASLKQTFTWYGKCYGS